MDEKQQPKRKRPPEASGRVAAEQQVQHDEQQAQAVRQTKQGLRQDEQGNRQDSSEITVNKHGKNIEAGQQQQDVTDQITTAHTEEILEVKARQDMHDHDLEKITEGVEFLAVQVTTLNERVYTKNYLDRTRNRLITIATATFLVISAILGLVLFQIKEQGKADARRATDRAVEAAMVRHQLADCELPPGVVLADGHVNPGTCFAENGRRTKENIDEAINKIEASIRELLIAQNEATARNRALTSEVRQTAAATAAALRRISPPTTSTTTRPPVTVEAPSSVPPPTPPTTNPGLICQTLRLLGLC